jgi:hypothetical protein
MLIGWNKQVRDLGDINNSTHLLKLSDNGSKMLSKKDPKDNSVPNIAELRAACKCFKCREPWVLGHAKTCKPKQVYFCYFGGKCRRARGCSCG